MYADEVIILLDPALTDDLLLNDGSGHICAGVINEVGVVDMFVLLELVVVEDSKQLTVDVSIDHRNVVLVYNLIFVESFLIFIIIDSSLLASTVIVLGI